MNLKKLSKLFENNSVSIFGKKGKGKDMLTANIINIRGKPYYSLFDYKCKNKKAVYFPVSFSDLNIDFSVKDILTGLNKKIKIDFQEGVDFYLSDLGIFCPSQYCGELNRYYSGVPVFMALSRHFTNSNIHYNTQNLNRVWDKIREQSEIYIKCQSCKVLFRKLVFMSIRVYEKYDSAVDNVPPFNLPKPLLNKERKQRYMIEKQRYNISYGKIKKYFLVFINRSNYDTRAFKKVFIDN